jgi:dienelactone hydrolase
LLIAFLVLPGAGFAEIKGEAVEYHHGDVLLEGFIAYDDAAPEKRPGVLVVHEWKGLNDYARKRAMQLAELGYVAFAADMYGKGVLAETNEEAGKLAGIYKADRPLMRARATAALDQLRMNERVDPAKLGAIGYCFGGTTVLELARSSADVKGVVSFHGGLDTPLPAEPGAVKGRVLVLHGAADPFVPPEEVEAFKEEMKRSGALLRFIAYEGAVHSFTNPASGDDPSSGAAYNAKADRESWEAMRQFFSEIL